MKDAIGLVTRRLNEARGAISRSDVLEDLDRQGILVDEVVAELDRNADHVIEGLPFPSSAAATVTWRTCPTAS